MRVPTKDKDNDSVKQLCNKKKRHNFAYITYDSNPKRRTAVFAAEL